MSTPKQLPVWVHEELKRINETYGAIKPFKKRAGIWDNTFKRLVDKGNGRADVVARVVAAVEANKQPEEITSQMIRNVVDQHRVEIIATLSSVKNADSIPVQLSVWLMRRDTRMDRRAVAEEVGYTALSNVNHAEQAIYNEMDINRSFRDLVYILRSKLDPRI